MRGARTQGRQRGFTFIEVSLTLALVTSGAMGIGALLESTHNVVTDVNRDTQARSIERRNIDSLSAILRGVPLSTLDNFGEDGIALAPKFSRSVNIIDGLPQPTSQAQLMWQGSGKTVVGVPNPGAIWLMESGGTSLAAKNVPLNGLAIEQDGKRLIIRLTTYYPGSVPEETVMLNSTTVVQPRN